MAFKTKCDRKHLISSTRPQRFLFVLYPNYFFFYFYLYLSLADKLVMGRPVKPFTQESTNYLKVFWGLGSVTSIYDSRAGLYPRLS